MDKLSRRVAALSPEQRELLALRARRVLPDVVIPGDPGTAVPSAAASSGPAVSLAPLAGGAGRAAAQEIRFSLLFFSAAGDRDGEGKYQLLLESARFADRHGFEAIWTPERHFQKFGGLYPNPAVLSAALAMVTERLEIRAGSLVLPLQNPIRVVEDWALLDNLSGGRVAVSFASGWNPVDFALAPEAYEERRRLMFEGIETVRRMWAEGRARVPGVGGKEVEVALRPRPLRPELPVWLTSSGTLETWLKAGEIGANVLCALQGEPAEDMAHRIRLYRQARREHGHDPGTGRVTVMLHTYLGDELAAVRETVRGPMTGYLRTFLAQGRSLEGGLSGIDPRQLSDRDLTDLAGAVFERFFEERSLLGTPETCERLLSLLQSIGVDEIACLVDFGLDPEVVLDGLERLAALKRRHEQGASREEA
ncbi:MAG TPA: MupA/Atu3671 family FMN-dependent luciferase-like monooxygenase [Thermoanaerobaculia bacterium]|nr:MupA/Atu3671 family FMN-dependent luciferase-like monooxygenase [Thermoanaerobaculia bacterium]